MGQLGGGWGRRITCSSPSEEQNKRNPQNDQTKLKNHKKNTKFEERLVGFLLLLKSSFSQSSLIFFNNSIFQMTYDCQNLTQGQAYCGFVELQWLKK